MPLMVEGYEKTLGGKLSRASFRHSVSYLLKARHILADSGATKNALIDILKLADKNITVVALGVDEIFYPTITGHNPKKRGKLNTSFRWGPLPNPTKTH